MAGQLVKTIILKLKGGLQNEASMGSRPWYPSFLRRNPPKHPPSPRLRRVHALHSSMGLRPWSSAKADKNRGVILLFVMLMLSALLSVSIAIAIITLQQLLITGRAEDSFIALYSTDHGLERALYRDFVQGPLACPTPCAEDSQVIYASGIPSGGCYTTSMDKSAVPGITKIKVTGQYRCISTPGRVVKRAFEYTYLSIIPPPSSFDYTLSATPPANIIVNQGGSGSNTVTLTSVSGTPEPVTLAVSGLPAGASPNFIPTSCTPNCSSFLTITTLSSTPTGSYTITVTGVSTPGGVTRTETFTLTVNPPSTFDYSLTNSGGISVVQGASDSNTININLVSAPSQLVSLFAASSPAESSITFAFIPTACNPTCSSALTVSTLPSTPSGSYTITVTGSPLGRTTSFTLTVNPAALFAFQNSAGTNVATVLGNGSLILKNAFTSNPTCTPSGSNEFVWQDGAGNDIAVMNLAIGSLCIEGSLSQNVTSFPVSGADDFEIQTADNTTVFFLDGNTGNLLIRGTLTENGTP